MKQNTTYEFFYVFWIMHNWYAKGYVSSTSP